MSIDVSRSEPPAAAESVYLSGDLSSDAITTSLRALLPTRHRPISRRRFTILDTFDGRVRRAGACLTREGEHGSATVAWQSPGGVSQMALRLKQPVSFAWDFPDGPLQQRVESVIGPRRLLAQAETEEYGSLLDVIDDRGKTVARLRIASGQARLPTPTATWRPLPTLVTVTGLRGYEDSYSQLLPVIASRPGLEPCAEGALRVTLDRVGAPNQGDVSLPRVDLPPAVRADMGARQIHLALLGILDANEPGLRANLDTEFLHDFRVAVRRTRSLLRQIRGVFPDTAVEHFSTEFAWIGRLTGPPRDLDVLVLSLRQRTGDLTASDRDALMSALNALQQHEHAQLVEALDSDRYRQLRSDWRSFLEQPAAAEPEAEHAGAPLADVVPRRAWRLSRRIAKTAKTIDQHTSAEQIHALRVDAKKLRYLVDVTPSFYAASDLTPVVTALKKLQRVLGDFNDADVQERRLLECGRALGEHTSASVLLTLGRLAEQCRQRREQLRPEVVDRLRQFRAGRTRSACRRAFKDVKTRKRAG